MKNYNYIIVFFDDFDHYTEDINKYDDLYTSTFIKETEKLLKLKKMKYKNIDYLIIDK